jgi:hypothetical protein
VEKKKKYNKPSKWKIYDFEQQLLQMVEEEKAEIHKTRWRFNFRNTIFGRAVVCIWPVTEISQHGQIKNGQNWRIRL